MLPQLAAYLPVARMLRITFTLNLQANAQCKGGELVGKASLHKLREHADKVNTRTMQETIIQLHKLHCKLPLPSCFRSFHLKGAT